MKVDGAGTTPIPIKGGNSDQNSDHGELEPPGFKSTVNLWRKGNSDHGPSFLPGKTQTMVRVNCQNGDGGGSWVGKKVMGSLWSNQVLQFKIVNVQPGSNRNPWKGNLGLEVVGRCLTTIIMVSLLVGQGKAINMNIWGQMVFGTNLTHL